MTLIERMQELERDARKKTHNLIVSNYLSLEDLCECIEALERREPMKPRDDDGRPYSCPACGSEYGIHADDYGDRPKYCSDCGQAIDWSDENDGNVWR